MIAPSLRWQETAGLRLMSDPGLHEEAEIAIAFTSRLGGVSPAPYDSLNLAFHVGDDPGNVLANRERACGALGLDFAAMTCAEQVHGMNVAVVGANDVGCGRDEYETAIPSTDALATDITCVVLAMFFADCVPVILVDPVRRAVGVAHAGWRGVLGNVAGGLVARMGESFGSSPADVLAYIGPAIGPCHYEVNAELAALFAETFPDSVGPDTACLDLPGLVLHSLDAAGIARQNVAAADECTAENTEVFYSYRSEGGKTGRHAAIVSIST